jgi:hypothetical protein
MMRIHLILLFLCFTLVGRAQEKVNLSNNQLNINILPLSLSYERKIDADKSFTINGGIAGSPYYSEDFDEDEFVWVWVPYVTSSFRRYYKRNYVKKDNLGNNSGNYYGLFLSYQFNVPGSSNAFNETVAREELSQVMIFGPVWGLQRNYGSRIHLSLSIGPGYMIGKNTEDEFSIVGDFELGYKLFSK